MSGLDIALHPLSNERSEQLGSNVRRGALSTVHIGGSDKCNDNVDRDRTIQTKTCSQTREEVVDEDVFTKGLARKSCFARTAHPKIACSMPTTTLDRRGRNVESLSNLDKLYHGPPPPRCQLVDLEDNPSSGPA